MKRFAILICGFLICAGLGSAAEAADEPKPLTGTWSLNNWIPGDSVHLTMTYRNAATRWQWGNDQPMTDLHGLTADQLHSTHASVAFTLQRDAGTFTFEGTLMLGIGRGDYRFTIDPTYSAKLSALGYGPLGDDAVSIMLMAVRDVSLAYAAEVKRSGLKDVAVSDLVRLQDHGVSLKFLRTLADVGYTNLTADDVVRFRDHGIDGTFLRALKISGAPELSPDDIVKLHDHGVKPEYVARIQSAGYPDLTVDQIIKLHEHGVN